MVSFSVLKSVPILSSQTEKVIIAFACYQHLDTLITGLLCFEVICVHHKQKEMCYYFSLWGPDLFPGKVGSFVRLLLADLRQVLLQYRNFSTVLMLQLWKRCWYFFCDLFYDTISRSDYIISESQ
jgi:hypothetical protein